MHHSEAIKRLRALFHRFEAQTEPLSGPTLLDQEPDLARETARYDISASAWAAGGHPTD